MSYTNSHRALLQAIMDRGAVSIADARELVVKLFGTFYLMMKKKIRNLC